MVAPMEGSPSVGAASPKLVNQTSSIPQKIPLSTASQGSSTPSDPTAFTNQIHVYVDNPPSPAWIQPATWFGVIALFISAFSLWKTLQKDKKAIQKSINDDFWIRKVLFELALSPALEFMSETEQTLPKYSEREKVGSYLENFSRKHRGLAGKLSIASVLDKKLFEQTRSLFESFEDVVTECCALLVDSIDESTFSASRSQAITEIRDLYLDILSSVKTYQQQI